MTVTANVNSEYYIDLPAGITFEEKEEDLYYTATYDVNVRGQLLGQKVTLVPVLNASAGDTDGVYHIKLNPLERNSDGSIKTDDTTGDPVIDSSKNQLPVTVEQPVYEWIPAGAASTESQRKKIDGSESISQGVLNTDDAATPDTSYRGSLTFFVSCVDY